MLGKIADIFGMQVRGRYRGNNNVTRQLSKVTLPLDGISEVLALFLTFPWLVCAHLSSCFIFAINFANWGIQ